MLRPSGSLRKMSKTLRETCGSRPGRDFETYDLHLTAVHLCVAWHLSEAATRGLCGHNDHVEAAGKALVEGEGYLGKCTRTCRKVTL